MDQKGVTLSRCLTPLEDSLGARSMGGGLDDLDIRRFVSSVSFVVLLLELSLSGWLKAENAIHPGWGRQAGAQAIVEGTMIRAEKRGQRRR